MCDDVKALKARGEPLLSGWECTPEAISTYFKPHGWQLLELLSPKCAFFPDKALCQYASLKLPALIFKTIPCNSCKARCSKHRLMYKAENNSIEALHTLICKAF